MRAWPSALGWTLLSGKGDESKDAILDIARQHGIVVVEDDAHGPFGEYRGELGTFGNL
jgi:dTDP-4-amino-4,6-dideoxygalactose transaminase